MNLDKIFEAIKAVGKGKKSQDLSNDYSIKATYLIIGLGNPGREYRNTRHNIGFKFIDAFAEHLGVEFSRSQSKALVTITRYVGNKIILAKPQTFMNKSGFATRDLIKFHKIDLERLLVVYDDVDLPFGKIRIKSTGGTAGHKGMKSIIEQLGTNQFPRMRLGVGRQFPSKQAANYVLRPFNQEESEFMDPFLNHSVEAALAFIESGIEYAMTHFNRGDF
jgi:PTH1 family peptidyl-tRNA hydrolase